MRVKTLIFEKIYKTYQEKLSEFQEDKPKANKKNNKSSLLKIIIFFIAFSLLIPFRLQGNSHQMRLIDSKDRKTLEVFFNHLIHRSSIGYCLCSDKPLATETFIKVSNLNRHICYVPKIIFEYYGYSILWNGWKCWLRYSHLFPSEKFVLRFMPITNTIVLVNKQACKNIIEENIELFQKNWNVQLSSEKILEKICNPTDEEILFKDTCLLGILYGFGRNNSTAFANRSYFQKLEPFTKVDPFNPFLGYGFFIINNGTNEKENKKVKKLFNNAIKRVNSRFTQKNNFQTFLNLYQN